MDTSKTDGTSEAIDAPKSNEITTTTDQCLHVNISISMYSSCNQEQVPSNIDPVSWFVCADPIHMSCNVIPRQR